MNISVLPMEWEAMQWEKRMYIFVFCLQILSCFVFAPDFSVFVLVYNVLILSSGIIAAQTGARVNFSTGSVIFQTSSNCSNFFCFWS